MRRTDLARLGLFAAALSAFVAAASTGCSAENSLVGGSCRAPYSECGGRCVDTSRDSLNCGACGNVCAAGVACVGGVCGQASTTLDGDVTDGDPSTRDSSNGGGDGSPDDGPSNYDGPTRDALADASADGSTGADAGDGGDGGDAQDAGDAGCLQPNLVCDGICTDVINDSSNCGGCGKVCPSNSCVSGACVGSAAGHIIAIGHDYQVIPAQNSSQARAIANAVFVAKSSPISVLSFEHYAVAQDVINVQSTLTLQAKKQGRTLSFTSTIVDSDIPNTLAIKTYDVLLVPDLRLAPSGKLKALGTTWSSNTAINDFLHAGGVIVILDGASGTGEMPDLETNMGVLNVKAHTALPAPSLTVLAPGDAVGSGVISPYVPTKSCAWFDTEPASGTVTYVVGNGANQPVIVHKVVP